MSSHRTPKAIMFVDRCQIEFQAGRGGDGCMSFRRERYVPKGGPDGGDGGKGGCIIIEARDGVDHLSALAHRKIWRSPKGMPGQGSNRNGRKGEDLVILVPPGTVVIDSKDGFIIRDLTTDGDSFVVARGGRRGRGNASFKNANNRAPRQFTRGDEGEKRIVIFELKAIADVGLIGKPNAGKSTLLSRLSHARPEIANYPFTTKHPNLGRVQIDINSSFVMADIPGLIEGAHEGVGLGHEFLRHVERAGILVHLVEPMPMDGTDPLENYLSIRKELTEYKVDLGERPELIVITKSELPDAAKVRDQIAEQTGKEVRLISAVTGEGLNKLTGAVALLLQEQAAS